MTEPRPGYDPAVVSWRIATAPRPRFSTNGRHWWRDTICDAFAAATHEWELRAEAASNGWKTELREFEEKNPRPNLKDFMVHLSSGRYAPEREVA